MSLARLALSLILGSAISTTVSIAVLNNSPPITKANNVMQINHSVLLIFKRIPKIITSKAILK